MAAEPPVQKPVRATQIAACANAMTWPAEVWFSVDVDMHTILGRGDVVRSRWVGGARLDWFIRAYEHSSVLLPETEIDNDTLLALDACNKPRKPGTPVSVVAVLDLIKRSVTAAEAWLLQSHGFKPLQ